MVDKAKHIELLSGQNCIIVVALHHIVVRGIERRKIFRDDAGHDGSLERLGGALLRTGLVPISRVMRRLLTGYAVTFNLTHRRSGHLFQNRHKSILCQEDAYFLELVRYTHCPGAR